MKVIHTFWSLAYDRGRWGKPSTWKEDVWCFALSLHFAKRWFGEIHLITDTEGMERLGDLPYTTMSTYLDFIHDVNASYWTAGKVIGMASVDSPVLHLDGDVFLLGERVAATLKGEWEVIVQHKEQGAHWQSTYPPILKWLRSKGVGGFENGYAYNHGIIGFRHPEFLRDYTAAYQQTLDEFGKRFHTFPDSRDPNIIVEQSLLAKMCEERGLKPVEILGEMEVKELGVEVAAERVGYVHLWGNSKYEPRWQEMVRRRLEAEDPALYEVVKKILAR
jgi:hypothetical protein